MTVGTTAVVEAMLLRLRAVIVLAASASAMLGAQTTVPSAPGRHRIEVRSSADGSLQPAYLYLPAQLVRPAPIAVLL